MSWLHKTLKGPLVRRGLGGALAGVGGDVLQAVPGLDYLLWFLRISRISP